MSIAFHPYLSDSPQRFGDVVKTYTELLAKPGVGYRAREQIPDFYMSALKEAV